jgi:WD40 repeat protein
LAWAPDGKTIASGSIDAPVRLHNTSTGKALPELDLAGSPPAVTGLAFSPSGTVLLAGRAN